MKYHIIALITAISEVLLYKGSKAKILHQYMKKQAILLVKTSKYSLNKIQKRCKTIIIIKPYEELFADLLYLRSPLSGLYEPNKKYDIPFGLLL